MAALALWPVDASRYLRTNPSAELLDRSGRPLHAYLNSDDAWSFPREPGEISAHLIQATIAGEDQRFYRHAGVDPIAVARAVWQNVRRGGVASGASTLTMQVVKQTDRSPRSLTGKACQAITALRLERHASKTEILAAYLDEAPYGLNLIGCDAAARRYFGKPAKELTLPEAALLAGLPKAPSAYMPLTHPDAALARRNYVLRRMRAEGFISNGDCERALAAPLGAAWHEFPTLAPHLAQRLKREASRGPLRTTLDAALQEQAERLTRDGVRRFAGEISNAAVIVIDAPTGAVLARVGSADFFATPGGGQVDACRAARSPGSALKPFTYGLAIERNCVYPSETLLDGTLDYGKYQPVNFDGRYRGMISASLALRRSLNVPAVAILDRVGYQNVCNFLKGAGLTTLKRPADYYGLGLTLGNCEVRLEELAAAYAMVARLGEYRAPRVLADAPADAPKRCLSAGTCLALYEMLEQPLPEEFDRSDFPSESVAARVCWKTGTSTGLHDAWAFVFNGQYVVGAWMGNNDGKPSARLVGAKAALPLAAAVFRSLPPSNAPAWPSLEGELRDTVVCAISGLPASPWCKKTKHVTLPRAQYVNRVCDMHYPGEGDEIIQRWPGSAKGWDLAKIETPRVAPGSKKPDRAEDLKITTPPDQSEFVLTGETNGDRVKLQASLDAQLALHWYVDERYLGASTPEKPVYLDLTPGKHKLACMTDSGSCQTATFAVTLPRASNFFSN
ncbi:MAG: penicillin-binding protein 1C [Candidatus Hydrogenedentes bacterium]|nr:penicillin-binding protein 1C [Candidatus Hydrogenedentota bacterium]